MSVRPLFVVLALGWPGLACDPTKELREQQSAAGVLRALESVRQAENQEKGKALAWLKQAPCVGAGVCELRDACSAAYGLHVEGVTLTRAAKQQLEAGKGEDAAKLVGAAEEKLRRASGDVEACLQQGATLRRDYELD